MLLKQIKNLTKDLGLTLWLQLLIVLGFVFAFLVKQCVVFFSSLLSQQFINIWNLSTWILDGYILLIFLLAPFILLYMVPRQKGLGLFYVQPLTKGQLYILLSYYYQKYQLLSLIIIVVLTLALIIIRPLEGIIVLFFALLYSGVVYSATLYLLLNSAGKANFFISLFSIFGIYFITSLVLILNSSSYFLWLFNFLFLLFIALFFAAKKRDWPLGNLALLYPLDKKIYSGRVGKSASRRLPHFLPYGLQMLFNAYFLSIWRNPAYRRLKIFTLIVYLASLFFIRQYMPGDVSKWVTLAGMAIIYLHYSNYFNRKYMLPEPEWYFKTLPHRFYKIWFGKFLSENIYILVLLFCHWLFLLLQGVSFSAQLNLMGILFLFSLFTIITMLNFQILFYDDPRLAGYAYNFLMLFLLVLSLNYHFVGPLVGGILLIFYFIKTYNFFRV